MSQVTQFTMTLAVAGQVPPETLASSVRTAIRAVDPAQAVYSIRTMQRVLSDSLSDRTMYLWLLGLFAGLALLLAIAGIYGVISYAVFCLKKKIVIRFALGVGEHRLLRLVLK